MIGKNIRKYRKAAGMTQQELAKHVGFSSKHLSRVECGRSLISLPLLLSTAEYLCIEPYKLLVSDADRNISLKSPLGNAEENEAFLYLKEQTEHFLSSLLPSLQNLHRESASSQKAAASSDSAASQHEHENS